MLPSYGSFLIFTRIARPIICRGANAWPGTFIPRASRYRRSLPFLPGLMSIAPAAVISSMMPSVNCNEGGWPFAWSSCGMSHWILTSSRIPLLDGSCLPCQVTELISRIVPISSVPAGNGGRAVLASVVVASRNWDGSKLDMIFSLNYCDFTVYIGYFGLVVREPPREIHLSMIGLNDGGSPSAIGKFLALRSA